ncbi:hypothetical protein ZHAS_00017285 [Anopheles sinensis]|uniref:Uncharacterized protein n=1 Tax=Anopheles sinensis TaxID=74873 RepID=A0A084WFY7_ANOSI|nr:hypothetical protein ZHAS_00017285 [Anopheles sinensis]
MSMSLGQGGHQVAGGVRRLLSTTTKNGPHPAAQLSVRLTAIEMDGLLIRMR